MDSLEMIKQERERQITQEGWTIEHDADHRDGELAMAAACYAAPETIYAHKDAEIGFFINSGDRGDRQLAPEGYYDAWPWELEADKRKKHDRLRRLTIAGALILAEMDRIQGEKSYRPQQQARER